MPWRNFDRRHARVPRPVTEPRRSAREPRHRGDDGAAGLFAGDKMAQPVLHEYPVVGPRIIGVERREGQKPDRFHGRVGFLRDRRSTLRRSVGPPPASPGRWCDSRTATRSCSASHGRRSTRAPTSRPPTSPCRTEWFPSATPEAHWGCRSSRQHKVLRQRTDLRAPFRDAAQRRGHVLIDCRHRHQYGKVIVPIGQ